MTEKEIRMPADDNTAEAQTLKILVVEDDADLGESIARYLKHEGHEVRVVGTAIKCYVALDASRFDLAVLDLSLPDQDGLILARYLRSNTRTAVLVLSARTTVEDRRMVYDAGAHLFIGKPVDFEQLGDAILHILDCAGEERDDNDPLPNEQHEGTWLMLQTDWDLVSPSGERAHLSAKEWDLMQVLANNANAVVSRESLVTALGYTHNEYGNRSLESILYRLRKKTAVMGNCPIKTYHGNGYGFMAPVTQICRS